MDSSVVLVAVHTAVQALSSRTIALQFVDNSLLKLVLQKKGRGIIKSELTTEKTSRVERYCSTTWWLNKNNKDKGIKSKQMM